MLRIPFLIVAVVIYGAAQCGEAVVTEFKMNDGTVHQVKRYMAITENGGTVYRATLVSGKLIELKEADVASKEKAEVDLGSLPPKQAQKLAVEAEKKEERDAELREASRADDAKRTDLSQAIKVRWERNRVFEAAQKDYNATKELHDKAVHWLTAIPPQIEVLQGKINTLQLEYTEANNSVERVRARMAVIVDRKGTVYAALQLDYQRFSGASKKLLGEMNALHERIGTLRTQVNQAQVALPELKSKLSAQASQAQTAQKAFDEAHAAYKALK